MDDPEGQGNSGHPRYQHHSLGVQESQVRDLVSDNTGTLTQNEMVGGG